MNKVILIGNIVKEVEPIFNSNGTVMVRNSIAVQRKFKPKDGERGTDFLPFIIFGKSAEIFANYVTKGNKIALNGRIEQNNYTDNEGKKVYSFNIVVEDFMFLEKKSDGEKTESNNFEPIESDDIPF